MSLVFRNSENDVLDRKNLPSTDKTELNYRVRTLSRVAEYQITGLVCFVVPATILCIALFYHPLVGGRTSLNKLEYAIGALLCLGAGYSGLTGARSRRLTLAIGAFTVAFCGSQVCDLVTWLGDDHARTAMLVGLWIGSVLITRQAAAWILVGPTVDHERMQRWKFNVPQLCPHGLSLDCPELLTVYAGALLILFASALAFRVAFIVSGQAYWWPILYPVACIVIWTVWHVIAFFLVPQPNFRKSIKMTVLAVVLFATYDIRHTAAAGVFRFPSRWLRSPVARWLFLICVMMLIGTSVAQTCPSLWDYENRSWNQIAINVAVIVFSGPMLLLCSVWMVGSTLLQRFDDELSHHVDPRINEWDNYIERIINSNDDLEPSHFLRGFAEDGDYPILVDEKIQEMHEHILGDSGASKTSLAICPLATQLIARADRSVVVIDLKGDAALFETCRREAERTKKLKFRWLTNEVGKTSFGFNPFTQTHNWQMTSDQVSQEILQGLALDYGIGYGEGYYTAMNETVLSETIKSLSTYSFKDLSKRLDVEEWYDSRGLKEEWKQAKHLRALVRKLGDIEALNVSPSSHSDQPEIINESLNVSDLYETPQVVYLSLRSSIDPINAPVVARLFMWAAFMAATHRSDKNSRAYFFVDEIQMIIGDSMKLIFEQFRDLGGTVIGAHQTLSQLSRNGTDLFETVESCTAVKQVFRASDLKSLERTQRLAGTVKHYSAGWVQKREYGGGNITPSIDATKAKDGSIRVSESEKPRFSIEELLGIGARLQSSLIRFTFGSGYTQFGGRMLPIRSPFTMSMEEYGRRRMAAWPTAPGAFQVCVPVFQAPDEGQNDSERQGGSTTTSDDEGYLDDLDRRLGESA